MKRDWKYVPLLAWAREHVEETKALIGAMVKQESPSDDAAALHRWAEWFEERATDWGARVERAPGAHLLCRFDGGRASQQDPSQQLFVLGHYDTVWPMGTLGAMPFLERDGRLWGPGVLDMKGGIALFLMAMRALDELDVPRAANLLLQLNADEETGSHTSRALTEANARASRAVLVLEPGTGLTGKLKTARKGVGDYRLRVTGKAAHAGVDFPAGASAILELAKQIEKIAGFTDLDRGLTVNPGVISGGTRANVIAAEAEAHIDVRIERMADAAALDARFRSGEPFDTRCSLEWSGGLNRPPMERSEGIGRLFDLTRELAQTLGVELEESSTGGGSDGNFTAALGVPTLDGLGAVGEGAHAPHESILTHRIADRMALIAMLAAEVI